MTRDYLKFMTSDLLMQFRGENCKNNIVLLSALAKQLDDLLEAFREIEDRTFLRMLNDKEDESSLKYGAHDFQLDRIGEIVDLTRKQATTVSNKIKSVNDIEVSGDIKDDTLIRFIKDNFSTYYPGNALGDSEYSEYLYYKIFLNSSYCTYADVIKSLEMFWSKSPIFYQENPEEPATIFLSTPELKQEQNARLFFLAPVVKAAGVRLFREATTVDEVRTPTMNIGGALFNGVIQSELPYLIIDHSFEKILRAPSRLESVVGNIIPNVDDIFIGDYKRGVYSVALKTDEYDKHKSIVYPAIHNGNIVRIIGNPLDRDPYSTDTKIEEISVPSTVEVLYPNAFYAFRNLNKAVISSGLKTLNGRAFYGCSSLKTVVFSLKSTFTNIYSETFYGCTSLEEIVLPETFNRVEVKAFYNCPSLRKIVYGGTEEQWNQIPRTFGNDDLFNAEIEFLGGST